MKYRIAILILCAVTAFELSALAQVHVQVPPAASVTPKGSDEPVPVLAVPQGYRYDARGRRDPFVNPIPKPAPPAVPEAQAARPSGLKGALVEEVTVVGVFVSKDDASMTRVILQVPGVKAPVIASRGEALFDAVIREIRPDAVVFAMSGNRDVVKKLRSTAGDKK